MACWRELASAASYAGAGSAVRARFDGLRPVPQRHGAHRLPAASGVVNASGQLGTSVGLAVLGSLGVTAAISRWDATVKHLPASARAAAANQAKPQVPGSPAPDPSRGSRPVKVA
jgi:hypothetical protein